MNANLMLSQFNGICFILSEVNNDLSKVTPPKSWNEALFARLFLLVWVFWRFFWGFSMNVSQSAAVFYDAVAPCVKDFPTTCIGQNALSLLRHSKEIQPLCVFLVGKWKHCNLPWSKWEMLPPPCHSPDTAVKAGTWPGHCWQITKVSDFLTQGSCFLLKCESKILLYQFLNGLNWYLQFPG